MKRKLNKKLLVVLLPVSMISLVGLGFSTWAATKQATKTIEINMNVGEVTTGSGNVEVFDNLVINPFSYYSGSETSGFLLDDGSYGNSGAHITGTIDLLVSNAAGVIESLSSSDKNLTIEIKLSATVNESNYSFSSNQITSLTTSSLHLTNADGVSYTRNSLVNADVITQIYTVSVADNTVSSIKLYYDLIISYGGSNFTSNFYNIFQTSGNYFSIAFNAGEAA